MPEKIYESQKITELLINKGMQINLQCYWCVFESTDCFILLVLTLFVTLMPTFFMEPSYELTPWVPIDFILTNAAL